MDQAEKINRLIAQRLGVDDDMVSDDKRLAEDLGADDLDVVELVIQLEIDNGVEITDEQAAAIRTVADCHALIRSLQAATA